MAISGLGLTLKKSSTSIGDIVSIDGPSIKGGKIDTSHAGISDGYKTCIPQLLDPGDIKVELIYDTTKYATLKTDCDNRTIATYTMTWNDGTTDSKVDFTAFVSEIGNKQSYDDKVTFSVTLSLTGTTMAFTAGS